MTSAVLRALQTTHAMGFRGSTVVVPEAREVAGWAANRPIDSRRAVCGDLVNLYGNYDWTLPVEAAREAGGARKYQRSVDASDSSASSIRSRAAKLTRYLQERPETSIALVSHGQFLERLTGDDYMDNCEVRSYRLIGCRWKRIRFRPGRRQREDPKGEKAHADDGP